MRNATSGGPAALATSAVVGGGANDDGTSLANDQGVLTAATMKCGSSGRSSAAMRESFGFFASQQVRRA